MALQSTVDDDSTADVREIVHVSSLGFSTKFIEPNESFAQFPNFAAAVLARKLGI